MSDKPPSASAFLQKHTRHPDVAVVGEADSSAAGVGTTEILSNLIEGLVNVSGSSGEDDRLLARSGSVSSMKHRRERCPYDQRLPKTYDSESDGAPSSVPYRGFAHASAPLAPNAPARPSPFKMIRDQLRGLFSPRATDMQQLLFKLQTQFHKLDIDHEKYALEQDGSMWDEAMRQNNTTTRQTITGKDPSHPLNNPKLITEVHFVGRKARDSAIVELSTLLMNHDTFGSIMELWLNDNLICDDGAAAIASFLQSPRCALQELWLGNNQIGPTGATLISASLSNNENSQLKCLGLYNNPIGNGGASTLAQMLRVNHTLSTVDVHGLRTGRSCDAGPEVLEGYDCKVIKANDGTDYVARVISSNTTDAGGVVSDQRLLDAIQMFVAFNRIDPNREIAIRGIMSSNKDQTSFSKFLSELCKKPANEKLTNKEKQRWKDCEWERLHLELDRARAAKSALANRLQIHDTGNKMNLDEEEGVIFEKEERKMDNPVTNYSIINKQEMKVVGGDLDDEVVKTESRSWCDLKMGITGSTKGPGHRAAPGSDQSLYVIDDVEDET